MVLTRGATKCSAKPLPADCRVEISITVLGQHRLSVEDRSGEAHGLGN